MHKDITEIKEALTDCKNMFSERGDKHHRIQKLATELFNQLKKNKKS